MPIHHDTHYRDEGDAIEAEKYRNDAENKRRQGAHADAARGDGEAQGGIYRGVSPASPYSADGHIDLSRFARLRWRCRAATIKRSQRHRRKHHQPHHEHILPARRY